MPVVGNVAMETMGGESAPGQERPVMFWSESGRPHGRPLQLVL